MKWRKTQTPGSLIKTIYNCHKEEWMKGSNLLPTNKLPPGSSASPYWKKPSAQVNTRWAELIQSPQRIHNKKKIKHKFKIALLWQTNTVNLRAHRSIFGPILTECRFLCRSFTPLPQWDGPQCLDYLNMHTWVDSHCEWAGDLHQDQKQKQTYILH